MHKDEDSTLLSKLLNLNPFKRSSDDKRSNYDEKKIPSNPINELQILNAHTDIVRIVVKLDELRIASASDDATINIWNYVTGERILSLVGHKMPITCLLPLDRNVLISGSSDRTIRMWDLNSGECTRVMTAHQGSIKALCMLPRGMFCSGANDRQLCIWNLDGDLMSTIERQEEEMAYHIENKHPFKILAYHRESVQCLVRISDKYFASASLDGCLVVWQTDTLEPGRVLAFPENYKSSEKIFIYSVHYLLPLGEGYLVVAIGKKVELYDILTGECVLECENTHESTITCMISLYGGTRLLTSSADSSIKIWELPNFTQLNSTFSNASCGGDGCVVLWKDGQVQSDMRNGYATMSLLRHTSSMEDLADEREFDGYQYSEFSDGSYDSSTTLDPSSRMDEGFYEDSDYDTHYHTHTPPTYLYPAPPVTLPMPLPSTSPSHHISHSPSSDAHSLTSSGMGRRSGSVTIPDFIFKHAEMLRIEKKLSLQTIAEELRVEGHSENLIAAVLQKQLSNMEG